MASTVEYKTPGVYVREVAAFPPSIVGIPTAIPAFIGYTETAQVGGKDVTNKPVAISSMAAFQQYFGGRNPEAFTLTQETPTAPETYDVRVWDSATSAWVDYTITPPSTSPQFMLYDSMELFYANGGGQCWVVSVGGYEGTTKIDVDALTDGLDAIKEQVGPTMLAVPDAVSLPPDAATTPWVSADFKTVAQAMLNQAATLQDRVALLDVYGSQYVVAETVTNAETQVPLTDLIAAFRSDINLESKILSYGIAYFPFLRTTISSESDYDYGNIEPATTLVTALKYQSANMYTGGYKDDVDTKIDEIATGPTAPDTEKSLEDTLEAMLPLLVEIENQIAQQRNLLPSSGAMAGVITAMDSARGVWNAPANVGLASVLAPSFNLNDEQQGDLNVPVNGRAIDAIREFAGKGTIVWGARTLDGNSPDYRYVQVRRTLIYIEQSIKAALDQFVFAPNTGQTWATVTAMVSTFLNGLWNQGGLVGDTPDEAYEVECGLGSTMTSVDILNGYMKVQVTLNMVRPAEFIVLTFTQKMSE